MRGYVIRRLLLVPPTVLLVTILVFFLIRLVPGDIIDQMAQEAASFTDVDRAALEEALGLDAPIPVQYARWLGVIHDKDGNFSGLLEGNLGDSLWSKTPVINEIAQRAPVTTELGILAMLIMLIIAIPIGVYSAIRQESVGDYAGRSFATLLIALPNFWVGLMIILVASIWFGMSPELQVIPFSKDPLGNLGQFIVPAFCLGMAGTGMVMRMTRSMMLEVLRQDYIRTAWAKGLRERVVIIRHALKNALIPVITLVGIYIRLVIGGAVIIETVFSLPGLGRLLVNATNSRDYTVVSGVIVCFAALMILANLVVDLAYAYLDPRIHHK